MATDTMDDLARLRAIAEEGRKGPLLGGRHLIVWGSAICAASLFHWGIVTQILPLPLIAIAAGWFGLMGLAAVLGRTVLIAGKPEATDIGNRVERAAWEYGGGFLGLLSVTLFAIAALGAQIGGISFYVFFAMLPPISFGIYAVALRVSAEASGVRTLIPYALAALAFAVLTAALAGNVWQFPVMAAGIVIVAILPGRMLVALEGGRG